MVITTEFLARLEVLRNSRDTCIALHFPLATTRTMAHRACFTFISFHVPNFLISLLISNGTFQDFYYYLHTLWPGKTLDVFSPSKLAQTCSVANIVTVLEIAS